MLTPTAAKELWCPMIRLNEIYPEFVPPTARCIAEKCAMWRWQPNVKYMQIPGTVRHSQSTRCTFPPETGYCGLAGRQEVCT